VDLDELGISICSVAGTNFAPYLTLLAEKGLRLPVAVMTDGDPSNGAKQGEARILALLPTVLPAANLAGPTREQQLGMAGDAGLFVGDHTLEVDLVRAGAHEQVCDTLIALAPGPTARTRAEGWRANPGTLQATPFLNDVNAISKGRFAQRLSSRIVPGYCPGYVANAIEYVRARCS
jgi:putative ATP-dependent endonuclease of the OLD family